MSIAMVLLPVFVQIGLTFALLVWMARSRTAVVMKGEVRVKDIALGQSSWPPRVTQIGNAFQSQFEVPVLFYVLVALAIITKKDDLAFVVLEWCFVLSRLAHAYVHTGTNNIGHRFRIFAIGFGILALMWVIFAVRILFA